MSSVPDGFGALDRNQWHSANIAEELTDLYSFSASSEAIVAASEAVLAASVISLKLVTFVTCWSLDFTHCYCSQPAFMTSSLDPDPIQGDSKK